jgi:2-polyprenyl-3-methyl-5-hydroxy-6-metoxy-1,4-benzoquinol methylase
MNRIKEKNVRSFNNDVSHTGRYVYTNENIYSACIATKRQSDEAIRIIKTYVGKNIKILDIGCGDGTFTFELLQAVKPKKITGFDVAENAIKVAKERSQKDKNKSIDFQICNIYTIDKQFGKEKYDLAVARGILHHLYNPELAIKNISKTVSKVIVIEPNGYNPILKVIELVSKYHREHEEKSYFPPQLNAWFIRQGFNVTEQKFVGVVPYFCPEIIARLLKKIEPCIETIPVISKFYLGSNIIFFEKG